MKGAQFERLICVRLSQWISAGERKDCLWRSAISGGRATVLHRSGTVLRQSGDITAVASEGFAFTERWFVECKFRKNLMLTRFFVEGQGNLAKWWSIAQHEAAKYSKQPMLIARQNRCPTLVVLPVRNSVRLPCVEIRFDDMCCIVVCFDALMDLAYSDFAAGFAPPQRRAGKFTSVNPD
jgi:hypothetical protein